MSDDVPGRTEPQDAPPPAAPLAPAEAPGEARLGGTPPGGEVDPIEPRLHLALERTPDARLWVSVRFREPPPPAELSALGLQPATENPVTGLLDRRGVLALADRDDVEEIDLRPEPTLT